jgi:beta-glucanase (GH16 family)
MKKILLLTVFAILSVNLFSQDSKAKWILVWSDEFDGEGLPDPQKWSFETDGNAWGWGNGEDQFYTDGLTENARRENGNLIITALKETVGGKQYTSARIRTRGKGEWRYGRFEARMKLPSGRGIWPAFWMMPASDTYGNWPASGEIDIMEYFGFIPDTTMATIHTARYNHKINTHKGKRYESDSLHTDFHVYAVEWFPDRLDFYFDDIMIFTFKKEKGGSGVWPFDQPFYLILNNAVGGDWCRQNGGIGDTPFPQEFLIDHVRVYKLQVPGEKLFLTTQEVFGGRIVFETGNNSSLSGDTIKIRAVPDDGYRFAGWYGDLSGSNPLREFRIFEPMTVMANFVPVQEILDHGEFWGGLTGWLSWIDSPKATGRFIPADRVMTIEIDKAPPEDWQVQLGYPVALEQGKRYRLTFKARSKSGKMPIRAGFNQNHEPWQGYKYETFMLTKDWEQYTVELDMTEPTDLNSRIEFDLGAKKGVIVLDSVSLVEVKGE